jgi:tetratricopeptide (TPR) repeat protein
MYAVDPPDRRRLAALVALLISASLFLPASGLAQNAKTVEPSQEQTDLNDQAVRSIIERDYARAVALLEESLLIGELNVTYYNLAQAYEGLGECRKAKKALDAAEKAPIVDVPSPERVREKMRALRDELPETCPTPAGASDTTLPPSGSRNSGEAPPRTEPPRPPIASYALFATSFALVGTGVAFHVSAVQNRNQIRDATGPDGEVTGLRYPEAQELESNANTFDNVAVGAFAAAGVAAGAGLVLLLTRDSPERAGAQLDGPAITIGHNFAGIQLRGRF